MKITVITITRDNGALLGATLESLRRQFLPEGVLLEHIIVDSSSGSEPEVDRAEEMGSRVIRTSPQGVYNAINLGLKAATGDIIHLLHGADIYADNYVLERAVEAFRRADAPDFLYGDVVFGNPLAPSHVTRYYSGAGFKPSSLEYGFAPPHPSLFIRREAQLKVGLYREDLAISGDFEMFVRLFHSDYGLKGKYIAGPAVLMSNGGLSSGLKTRLVDNTRELYKALRDHGLRHSRVRVLARFLYPGKYRLKKK